jgi:hypothetical protein
MPDFRLSTVPWLAGTGVDAYTRTLATVVDPSRLPPGAPVDTEAVASDGSLTFTLDYGDYFAVAPLGGVYRYVAFALETAASSGGTGDGVAYVATDADLPATTDGHPVVLVLADSEADGQASLRYWSGTGWLLLGLAGGGVVGGDVLELGDATNLAGIQDGQTVIWDGVQWRPGALA